MASKILTNSRIIKDSQFLEIDFPKNANIRKYANEILKDVNDIALIKIIAAGTRILNNYDAKNVAQIANGRNIRIYYALKKNNKIKINYIKYKIKHLSLAQQEYLEQNWSMDFFETMGKQFIKQMSGCVLENILINI